MPPADSGRRLVEYARRHPCAAAALMRAIGQQVDGSATSYERVGADRDGGVPLVALTPHRHSPFNGVDVNTGRAGAAR